MNANKIHFKITIIGETNVGKTNIISRIMSKPFNYSYENTLVPAIDYYNTELTIG